MENHTRSDVYVSMRHLGCQFKTSLHETGECNIGYTREMAAQVPERLAYIEGGRRHAFSWQRPITGRSSDCTWSYALRIVIPYSELRTSPVLAAERHVDSVTFIPTQLGALCTEFSFVFVRGACPPSWPGMGTGARALCKIKLPNNETFFVVYFHYQDDGLFREPLTRMTANRQEVRRLWAELRREPLGPHFREGVFTTCTDGSLLVVEVAGD